jgi:hypothetical protein
MNHELRPIAIKKVNGRKAGTLVPKYAMQGCGSAQNIVNLAYQRAPPVAHHEPIAIESTGAYIQFLNLV